MNQMPSLPDPDAERKRIIKQRNWMLGGLLGGLVVLFYYISIARIGG
jgi:hypothetical protein